MTAPELPDCPDGTCVTCADAAVPARVVALLPHGMARVATGAGLAEVSVALVPARVGDTVLVHAGEAIAMPAAPGAPGAGPEQDPERDPAKNPAKNPEKDEEAGP